MKLIVNGVEKELEILYGRSAMISYEQIVRLAGVPEEDMGAVGTIHYTSRIDYEYGRRIGYMVPGDRAVFPVDSVPKFTFEVAAGADQ